VRHQTPFGDLETPRNEHHLTKELIEEWITPFYINSLEQLDAKAVAAFDHAAMKINQPIVAKLLGDSNWRSRIVGALFAATMGYKEFEQIIGRSLLKSESCFAGSGYCVALTTFGTDDSRNFLITYLDYYLGRKDLWFNQADAYCALEYLDKEASAQRLEKWIEFVSDKPNWNLDRSRMIFLASIKEILHSA
jgi:hypothetical protein